MIWQCKELRFNLSSNFVIMGILNVTPDSFSDGGLYSDPSKAAAHGDEMLREGARIIDIGGESSRPGAIPVTAEEELGRVLPVIRELKLPPNIAVSIDTTKYEVAEAALESGAHILNDITAMRKDERMAELAAETGAGVVLMHMQGDPQTMQTSPTYADVTAAISDFLLEREAWCVHRGMTREQIAFDPGIGFGKTYEHNLEILSRLEIFAGLGRPLVVGCSRKAFLRRLLGIDPKDISPDAIQRLRIASTSAAVACLFKGASVVRVHDVRETEIACRTAWPFRRVI